MPSSPTRLTKAPPAREANWTVLRDGVPSPTPPETWQVLFAILGELFADTAVFVAYGGNPTTSQAALNEFGEAKAKLLSEGEVEYRSPDDSKLRLLVVRLDSLISPRTQGHTGVELETRRRNVGADPEVQKSGLVALAKGYLAPPTAEAIRTLAAEIDELRAKPPETREGKEAAVQLVNALLDRFRLRIEVDGEFQVKLIVKASSEGGTIQFLPPTGGSFGGFTTEVRSPGPGRKATPKSIRLIPAAE